MPSALYVQNQTTVDAVISHYAAELSPTGAIVAADQLNIATVNWFELLTRLVATLRQFFSGLPASEVDRRQATNDAVMEFFRRHVIPAAGTPAPAASPAAASGGLSGFFQQFFMGLLQQLFANGLPNLLNTLLPTLINQLYDALSKIFNVTPPAPLPPSNPTPVNPVGFQPY
jgi:hypothetical protein